MFANKNKFIAVFSIIVFTVNFFIPLYQAQALTPGTPPSVDGVTQDAYWKFDEGTGSTTADEVGTNTGTLTNSPNWVQGRFQYSGDSALNFNGIDQYVNVGTLGNFGSSFGTNSFELWYKTTSTDPMSFMNVFDGTAWQGVALSINGYNSGSSPGSIIADPGKIAFQLTKCTGSPTPCSTYDILEAHTTSDVTNLTDGSWHMIAFAVNTSTNNVDIYFDGQPLAVSYAFQQSPVLDDFVADVFIGAENNTATSSTAYLFEGNIDNLIIYNEVLDAATVLAHYQNSLPQEAEDVTIFASVDPTISISLNSNTCELGSLSSTTVNGCEVTVTTSTNATDGYTLYVQDANNGPLQTSVGDTIDAVASSPISAGTEAFGISTSATSQGVAQTTNCNTVPSTNTSAATALTSATQTIGGSTAPVNGEATNICMSASITETTPAGSYSNVVTITMTANF